MRLETMTNKFVYCYYIDGFGQVARIFPNRYQLDAFVPAGRNRSRFRRVLNAPSTSAWIWPNKLKPLPVWRPRSRLTKAGLPAPKAAIWLLLGLQMEGLLNAFDRLSARESSA